MKSFEPAAYGPEFAPLLATDRRRPLDSARGRPLDAGRSAGLAAGNPDAAAFSQLEGLSVKSAFAHAQVADPDFGELPSGLSLRVEDSRADMAACCISAVWLLYDELDRSHTISQGIETPSGSFWHGIIHRREGDFSNSKYWFRRVGRHDVFAALASRAAELASLHSSGEGDSPNVSHGLRRTPFESEPQGRRQSSGLGKIGTVAGGGEWDPFAFVDLCELAVRGKNSDVRDLCLDVQQAEWELLFDHCYRAAVGE